MKATGENQLRETVAQLRRRITSAFTAVTVTVHNPTNAHVDDPDPEPEAPPTSLALPWRVAFLSICTQSSGALFSSLFIFNTFIAGVWTPLFAIGYAATGDERYLAIGIISTSTCQGAMLLFYFSSLDPLPEGTRAFRFCDIIKRENRSLAVMLLFRVVNQL